MKPHTFAIGAVVLGAIGLVLPNLVLTANSQSDGSSRSNDIRVNSSGLRTNRDCQGAQENGPRSVPKIEKPPAGVQTIWLFYKPTQYLQIQEFKIHVFGTATVSEWMMRESYVLIHNMVAALKRDEDRRKFAGHQAFLITDADPDLTQIGAVPGHRNTGGRGFSLFNEVLVCAKAVDTIRPNAPPAYRGWNTPVHEFGHAIEHTLKLESRSDKLFSKNTPNYNSKVAREYFAWATGKWFASDRVGSPGRKALPKWEYDYLATIFSEDNEWVPNQAPRP
ncbi:MAG: hypothetical protein WC740_11460 [Verrucomicrobiia bacterium]